MKDYELWTIGDLLCAHPEAKNESFWRILLVEMNKRLQTMPEKRELCRHIESALNGRY